MSRIFIVKDIKEIILLVLTVTLVEGAGLLSGLIGMVDMNTYNTLIKPGFIPPNFAFAIVWIILYLLIAIAFYRILAKENRGVNIKNAKILFAIQLVLNFLWPIIFFRLNLRGIALLELFLLLIFIILTTIEFCRKDKISAYLMIPYILWTAFAAFLNYSFWILNK